MLKKFSFHFLFLLLCTAAQAQTKYWVFFKDKPQAEEAFDPYSYFHKNALDRRLKAGLPLNDFTDLPVNNSYINSVTQLADSAGNISRWFNGMGVWATAKQIQKIAALPFVSDVQQMTIHLMPAETEKTNQTLALADTTLLGLQLTRMQGMQFPQKEIKGQGIRIAVFDVGFRGVDTHEAFRQLRDRNKIVLTQDFIKGNNFVYDYGTHGTMVLSCIAGMYRDSLQMGLAPEAEFLLARTERNLTEWRDEEDNWIAAMEWADKNGAQLISSSLGYTFKRYFYRDMDGKTSLVARAANLAAKKGILVVTAAGNDGRSAWKYICTPGDADSALTIGGIDPETNYHISFSSYGPAADETLKPNVSAAGLAFVADSRSYTQAMGTSFATPLITGFAACAWQMNPNWSNMELFKELEKSASLYPYFDYAHGYGVPQASYFIMKAEDMKLTPGRSFSVTNTFDHINIKLDDKFFTDTALNAQLPDTKLFYHIAGADGRVLKYYVIQPKEQSVLTLLKEDLPAGGTLRIHFLGHTEEIKY